MTISYSGDFFCLLLKWRGSLWKAIYRELAIFLCAYYSISLVYRFAMTSEQKREFEAAVVTFDDYTKYIPLTFLLGFYISTVVGRWWAQFEWVAWPDDLLSAVCFALPGADERQRLRRHQIARYLVLTCALAWRDISVRVRRRFPTVEHLVKIGLMTEIELQLYESVQPKTICWAIPLQWTESMINKQYRANKIAPPIASSLLRQIAAYRTSFRKLFCYDWIDFFVPIYTIIEFLFYIGWFKVGQFLMRPFGLDDDDIELNYLLDRHIRVAFAMADNMCEQEPPLVADRFSGDPRARLSHTQLSAASVDRPPPLHAHFVQRRADDAQLVCPPADQLADAAAAKTPLDNPLDLLRTPLRPF